MLSDASVGIRVDVALLLRMLSLEGCQTVDSGLGLDIAENVFNNVVRPSIADNVVRPSSTMNRLSTWATRGRSGGGSATERRGGVGGGGGGGGGHHNI